MVLSPASTAEITLLNNVYRCSTVRKCREGEGKEGNKEKDRQDMGEMRDREK